MTIELRKPKSSNGGLGGGCKKNIQKLKPISIKQIKRTNVWNQMYMEYKRKEVELYGTPMCWAGVAGWGGKCFGELFGDHINTRNLKNPDTFLNMQGICSGHNIEKGSIRNLDFRTPMMQAACAELEKERLRKLALEEIV